MMCFNKTDYLDILNVFWCTVFKFLKECIHQVKTLPVLKYCLAYERNYEILKFNEVR